MKKIFTLVIVAGFLFQRSNAQDISSHTVMLGGTLGFSRQEVSAPNVPTVTIPSFALNPSIGKFYRPNRMAGINIYFSSVRPSDHSQTYDNIGGGIFLRQYVPLGRSFYLFGEEGLSVQHEKQASEQTGAANRFSRKRTTGSLYFNPGIAYGISRHFQLELALNRILDMSYFKESSVTTINGSASKNSSNAFSVATGFSTNAVGNLAFGAKWLL